MATRTDYSTQRALEGGDPRDLRAGSSRTGKFRLRAPLAPGAPTHMPMAARRQAPGRGAEAKDAGLISPQRLHGLVVKWGPTNEPHIHSVTASDSSGSSAVPGTENPERNYSAGPKGLIGQVGNVYECNLCTRYISCTLRTQEWRR